MFYIDIILEVPKDYIVLVSVLLITLNTREEDKKSGHSHSVLVQMPALEKKQMYNSRRRLMKTGNNTNTTPLRYLTTRHVCQVSLGNGSVAPRRQIVV